MSEEEKPTVSTAQEVKPEEEATTVDSTDTSASEDKGTADEKDYVAEGRKYLYEAITIIRKNFELLSQASIILFGARYVASSAGITLPQLEGLRVARYSHETACGIAIKASRTFGEVNKELCQLKGAYQGTTQLYQDHPRYKPLMDELKVAKSSMEEAMEVLQTKKHELHLVLVQLRGNYKFD